MISSEVHLHVDSLVGRFRKKRALLAWRDLYFTKLRAKRLKAQLDRIILQRHQNLLQHKIFLWREGVRTILGFTLIVRKRHYLRVLGAVFDTWVEVWISRQKVRVIQVLYHLRSAFRSWRLALRGARLCEAGDLYRRAQVVAQWRQIAACRSYVRIRSWETQLEILGRWKKAYKLARVSKHIRLHVVRKATFSRWIRFQRIRKLSRLSYVVWRKSCQRKFLDILCKAVRFEQTCYRRLCNDHRYRLVRSSLKAWRQCFNQRISTLVKGRVLSILRQTRQHHLRDKLPPDLLQASSLRPAISRLALMTTNKLDNLLQLWITETRRVIACKSKLSSASINHRSRLVRRYLQTWILQCNTLRLGKRIRLKATVMLGLFHLQDWHHVAINDTHIQASFWRIYDNFSLNLIAKSFQVWKEQFKLGHQTRQFIQKIKDTNNELRTARILKVWAVWATWNANIRRKRKMIERKVHRRLLQLYLVIWAKRWAGKRQGKKRVVKIHAAIDTLLLRDVLRTWRSKAKMWTRLEGLGDRQLARYRTKLCHRLFRVWKDRLQARRNVQDKEIVLYQMRLKAMIANAFHMWHSNLRAGRRLSLLGCTIEQLYWARLARFYWHQWIGSIYRLVSIRNGLLKLIGIAISPNLKEFSFGLIDSEGSDSLMRDGLVSLSTSSSAPTTESSINVNAAAVTLKLGSIVNGLQTFLSTHESKQAIYSTSVETLEDILARHGAGADCNLLGLVDKVFHNQTNDAITFMCVLLRDVKFTQQFLQVWKRKCRLVAAEQTAHSQFEDLIKERSGWKFFHSWRRLTYKRTHRHEHVSEVIQSLQCRHVLLLWMKQTTVRIAQIDKARNYFHLVCLHGVYTDLYYWHQVAMTRYRHDHNADVLRVHIHQRLTKHLLHHWKIRAQRSRGLKRLSAVVNKQIMRDFVQRCLRPIRITKRIKFATKLLNRIFYGKAVKMIKNKTRLARLWRKWHLLLIKRRQWAAKVCHLLTRIQRRRLTKAYGSMRRVFLTYQNTDKSTRVCRMSSRRRLRQAFQVWKKLVGNERKYRLLREMQLMSVFYRWRDFNRKNVWVKIVSDKLQTEQIQTILQRWKLFVDDRRRERHHQIVVTRLLLRRYYSYWKRKIESIKFFNSVFNQPNRQLLKWSFIKWKCLWIFTAALWGLSSIHERTQKWHKQKHAFDQLKRNVWCQRVAMTLSNLSRLFRNPIVKLRIGFAHFKSVTVGIDIKVHNWLKSMDAKGTAIVSGTSSTLISLQKSLNYALNLPRLIQRETILIWLKIAMEIHKGKRLMSDRAERKVLLIFCAWKLEARLSSKYRILSDHLRARRRRRIFCLWALDVAQMVRLNAAAIQIQQNWEFRLLKKCMVGWQLLLNFSIMENLAIQAFQPTLRKSQIVEAVEALRLNVIMNDKRRKEIGARAIFSLYLWRNWSVTEVKGRAVFLRFKVRQRAINFVAWKLLANFSQVSKQIIRLMTVRRYLNAWRRLLSMSRRLDSWIVKVARRLKDEFFSRWKHAHILYQNTFTTSPIKKQKDALLGRRLSHIISLSRLKKAWLRWRWTNRLRVSTRLIPGSLNNPLGMPSRSITASSAEDVLKASVESGFPSTMLGGDVRQFDNQQFDQRQFDQRQFDQRQFDHMEDRPFVESSPVRFLKEPAMSANEALQVFQSSSSPMDILKFRETLRDLGSLREDWEALKSPSSSDSHDSPPTLAPNNKTDKILSRIATRYNSFRIDEGEFLGDEIGRYLMNNRPPTFGAGH